MHLSPLGKGFSLISFDNGVPISKRVMLTKGKHFCGLYQFPNDTSVQDPQAKYGKRDEMKN